MSSPLSLSDKASLVEKANALTRTLRDPTIHDFAPHLGLFRELSDGLRRVTQALENGCEDTEVLGESPAATRDRRPSITSNLATQSHGKASTIASSAIYFALSFAQRIRDAARDWATLPDVHHQRRPQELHIQNIFALQKRRPSQETMFLDKMLLLCACQSLSADFRQFELRNGWTPKRDEISRR
ncbi:hypothetical protein M438DRAFT_343711 [Aureobasidium pullulans EXF-150]|uniref:Uncharacterized protein n=1 Tax=Aureobasidium pullulans EXF-150 TaxID=1043002 RepID=A0A074XP73_AURPU|nr:uncharacterized protein M438DRAFT_343711 [Aureobasidium pullulans EXF-150]KEQ87353.1 hypothetical protein M438DRAFT_343711 [Aureobasidium pullulans EXF-150]